MPQAWEHAVVDLMVFGRSYFDLHQDKDAPSAWLGRKHRERLHEWYNAFGDAWTFEDPFPEECRIVIDSITELHGPSEGEAEQARCAHDYLDKSSDLADADQRAFRRAALAWLVLHPEMLESRFGVDVDKGRILREVDDKRIWESCPELIDEYHRLRTYVGAVLQSDDHLRALVEQHS